jgi:hypothetical protein
MNSRVSNLQAALRPLDGPRFTFLINNGEETVVPSIACEGRKIVNFHFMAGRR